MGSSSRLRARILGSSPWLITMVVLSRSVIYTRPRQKRGSRQAKLGKGG